MSKGEARISSTGDKEVAAVEQEIGQIARGAGIGLGGNAVNTAISYLFGILVARQIGADQYGLYTLGVTAVTLVSRFTIVGLDRGLLRFASISRSDGQGHILRRLIATALAIGATVGLAGGAIMWLYPQWLLGVFNWTDKPEIIPLLRAFGIAVAPLTVIAIAIAGTQAFRTVRYRALVVNVIQPLIRLPLALALIPLIGPLAAAPVLAFVITQIVGVVLSLYFLLRLERRVPRQPANPIGIQTVQAHGLTRRLMRFSLPLSLANVLEYLNGRTEIIVIGIFLTAGAAGIFNAASRMAGLGLIVLTAVNAIFAPVISDLHHRAELARLATLYKLSTRWVLLAAMPLIVVQIVFAEQFMSLFGPEFAAGAVSLQLLSLGQLINFAVGSAGLILIMIGRSTLVAVNSVLAIGLSFALDFWLIPILGLNGAALAAALALAALNLVRMAEVWRLLGMHPFSPAYRKPFLAAVPATLMALAWLKWLPLRNLLFLAAASIAVGLVYLAALWLLRFDAGDHLMFDALRTRIVRLLPLKRRKGDELNG